MPPIARLVAVALLASAASPAAALAVTTERVSVDSAGAQGNALSRYASISEDGRYVAFSSLASNLVPGDTNGQSDIFVHDRRTGATERVSVTGTGGQLPGESRRFAMTPDGRYVGFSNSLYNHAVYVRDRSLGETRRAPCPDGEVMEISADGRLLVVSFWVPGSIPGGPDYESLVVVCDRQTGATDRVNADPAGGAANAFTFSQAAMSADGRFVAFASEASNLVAGDTNAQSDVFVRDRRTGTTERVSVDSAGGQANLRSYQPAISADGRHVAFFSLASDLVPGDTNGRFDVYVHDRETGQTRRVSVDAAGANVSGSSFRAAISADGRYVAFQSDAPGIVPEDVDDHFDVFVHDRATATTTMVSGDSTPGWLAETDDVPSLSADGRVVAFPSSATGLVPGDSNGVQDVFVTDSRPPAGMLSLAPDADARVEEATPTANFGASASLRADGGSDPDAESLLRFTVPSVPAPVASAKLRLYATNATRNGPALYGADVAAAPAAGGWTESAVTWTTRPTSWGEPLDDLGAVGSGGGWVEYDVGALVRGPGTYALRLATGSTDGITFRSREHLFRPQLLVALGGA